MVGEVSWDSRFLIGLFIARVKRQLTRRVVGRIHDFRGDPFTRHFQAPTSGKTPTYFEPGISS